MPKWIKKMNTCSYEMLSCQHGLCHDFLKKSIQQEKSVFNQRVEKAKNHKSTEFCFFGLSVLEGDLEFLSIFNEKVNPWHWFDVSKIFIDNNYCRLRCNTIYQGKITWWLNQSNFFQIGEERQYFRQTRTSFFLIFPLIILHTIFDV